jgi:hypothetical protein
VSNPLSPSGGGYIKDRGFNRGRSQRERFTTLRGVEED